MRLILVYMNSLRWVLDVEPHFTIDNTKRKDRESVKIRELVFYGIGKRKSDKCITTL